MPSILGNKINEQIQFQTELYLVIWGAQINVRIESNRIMVCRFLIFVLASIPYPFFFYFPDYTTGNSWNTPNFIAFEIISHIYSMKWIHIEVRMLAIDRRKDDINGSLLHFISICDSFFCLHCVFWYHFISSMLSDALKK